MLGKVVLITGASSGIGAGAAVHFASRGCLLSLTGRSMKGLEETEEACVRAGSKKEDILLIPADLQILEDLSMILKKTIEKFGKLDVLVNNAGCAQMENLESTTEDIYDTIMNTNLKSVFFLTQLSIPYLMESKGNIVNVSSVVSSRASNMATVYGMSKAALDHFTRSVALHLATKDVRVNAVNPGGVKTKIAERAGVPDAVMNEMLKKFHAMGRGGTVEEIAAAIAFLADDTQASFVTGITLLVDGGSNLMGPM